MRTVLFAIIILISAEALRATDYPTKTDTLILASGAILTGGIFFFSDKLTPTQPRVTGLFPGDRFFQNRLRWQNTGRAKKMSDITLFGLIVPSVLWVPATINDNYFRTFHVMAEVAVLNGFFVNLTKVLAARARPDAPSSDLAERKADNFHSFYSGHASLAFALAVSASILLSSRYTRHKPLIYGSFLSLAAITSYLRIAGNRHYFSDVAVGAIMGSLIGYLVTQKRLQHLSIQPTEQGATISKVLLRW